MKILKEPLVHFVLIGGLIFAAYQAFDSEAKAPGEHEIHVSPGRIMQLSAIFQKTWQRSPTHEELEGLVDDFILEEVYYREASAAGLDHDDTLIRRRLRQKMEFLSEDLSANIPDDEQLREFVSQHPDRFRRPPFITFRQIYFNPEQLGEDGEERIKAVAAQLARGEEPESHATLLPPSMSKASPQQIARNFGAEFTQAIADLEVGKWSAPIRSDFGIHFVRVDDRTEAALPPLKDIRDTALREWEHDQRADFRERFQNELRSKYEVTVEWPEPPTPRG